MDRTLIEQYAAGADHVEKSIRGLLPADFAAVPVPEKLAIAAAELGRGPTLESIEHHLTGEAARAPLRRYAQIREEEIFYGERDEEISF